MINIGPEIKIYLYNAKADMRKGINGLSLLAQTMLKDKYMKGAMFVFRGRQADKIKILWWDGQGFCIFYKCLDSGKFMWPSRQEEGSTGITPGQLSMLIEGIDWRNPRWSSPPEYVL